MKIARLNNALLCLYGFFCCHAALASDFDGGHLRLSNTHSITSAGHSPINLEGRLNFKGGEQQWRWQFDIAGESNLDCMTPCSDQARVDRANLSYQQHNFTLTLGRHAISWGNGLIFNPVDIFNPFDPLAINRDYKPGDDMIHAEIARANGDNIQYLYIKHESEHSLAAKYHGFNDTVEYDILLAKLYGNTMASFGLNLPLGDWLWRTDIQYQQLDDAQSANSFVSNLQRFFEFAEKPTSLTLEWYHNGLGLDASPSEQQLQHLFTRLNRGEIFTPCKDYLAIALMSQMTALWNLGITSISEAQNDQHIVQIISHHSLANNVELAIALNLPWGSDHWSSQLHTQAGERSISAQLSWYF